MPQVSDEDSDHDSNLVPGDADIVDVNNLQFVVEGANVEVDHINNNDTFESIHNETGNEMGYETENEMGDETENQMGKEMENQMRNENTWNDLHSECMDAETHSDYGSVSRSTTPSE